MIVASASILIPEDSASLWGIYAMRPGHSRVIHKTRKHFRLGAADAGVKCAHLHARLVDHPLAS